MTNPPECGIIIPERERDPQLDERPRRREVSRLASSTGWRKAEGSHSKRKRKKIKKVLDKSKPLCYNKDTKRERPLVRIKAEMLRSK